MSARSAAAVQGRRPAMASQLGRARQVRRVPRSGTGCRAHGSVTAGSDVEDVRGRCRCRRSGTRRAAAWARGSARSATRVAAVVFHCARRERVLLRDIFRLGTATADLLGLDGRARRCWSYSLCWRYCSCCRAAVVGQAEGGPPGVDRLVPVARVVREPRPALRSTDPGSRPGTPAGAAARAPPRPAAPVRGRAGRPRAAAVSVSSRLVVLRRAAAVRRRAPGRPPRAHSRSGPGSARTRRSPCAAHRPRDQHALHHRLEPEIQLEVGALRDAEHVRRRDPPVPEQIGRACASTLVGGRARGCRSRGATGGRGAWAFSWSLRA